MTDKAEHKTENQRKIMTKGRSVVDITEDDENVYLAEWVIPKGQTKEDGAERRRIIWEMYESWKTENPSGKRYNKALKDDIIVDNDSISETATHAYKNYKNVVAFYCLDKILANAKKIKNADLESNRQKKKFKAGYVIIMNATINTEPYFKKANLVVGVTKRKEKIMYSVTSIDIK